MAKRSMGLQFAIHFRVRHTDHSLSSAESPSKPHAAFLEPISMVKSTEDGGTMQTQLLPATGLCPVPRGAAPLLTCSKKKLL